MHYCFISGEPDTFDELCFAAVLFEQQKLPFELWAHRISVNEILPLWEGSLSTHSYPHTLVQLLVYYICI